MSNLPSLIWVHEGALSLDNPVFKAAGEGAKAVFIWYEVDLQRHSKIIEVETGRLSDIGEITNMARFLRFWNKAKQSIMKVFVDE